MTVPTPFLLPFSQDRPQARHPIIIEDLLEIADGYPQVVVNSMVVMLRDLYQNGRDSRFISKLHDLPLSELKTRSRGGAKGGARVYFAFTNQGEAIIINAEVKAGDSPSSTKIEEALRVLLTYKRGCLRF
jgi:hypothetical protein